MTNLFEQTLSNTIDEAIEKLKALRPVVKWDYNDAIHAQEVCVSEYIEARYTDTEVKCLKDTMYMDVETLHLYIAEWNGSQYSFVELVWDELDPYDIAEDIRTIDSMGHVDALWLTDKVNREHLIQLLRESIAEDEESMQKMVIETWDDLMARDALGYNIEFNQYIIDRLVKLN